MEKDNSSAAGAAPIAPVRAASAAWHVETVPTSVGHCHKIKIDPEGITSRGPGYDDALIACVYVDHRDMREKDRRTLVGAERARLIAAAPDLLEALKQLEAFVAVVHGEGPEASIPERVPTRLGIPVKLGDIMRNVSAALTKAGE